MLHQKYYKNIMELKLMCGVLELFFTSYYLVFLHSGQVILLMIRTRNIMKMDSLNEFSACCRNG